MKGDERFQFKDYLRRPYPGKRSGKLPIDQAVASCIDSVDLGV